jgi:hypothetical protein
MALLFVIAAGCAVWSWRTVPVAAAMLVPLAAGPFQGAIGRESAPSRWREVLALGLACVLAAAALAAFVPGRVTDPTGQPSWLQPELSSLPTGTEVLSTWDTSAILMWKFPQLDVIANGYGDTYTLPELQRSADIQAVAQGWAEELKSTGCTVAVLATGIPLANALQDQEHWNVLRRSDGLELLVAPSGWSSS